MTLQFRTNEQTGTICCTNPKYACDACTAYFADQADTPPDPYAAGITALRAAEGRLPSYTDREVRAVALAAIEIEAQEIAAANAEAFRLLADDNLDDYAPPNPYAEPLRRMKEAR